MIKSETMLSYDDVLLIPRKSNFNSRSETDISCVFSKQKYSAPIVMSPMTCVTSPEMIFFFIKEGLVPTVHRYFQNAKSQYDYVYLGMAEQIILEENGVECFDWENRKRIRHNVVDFTFSLKEKIEKNMNEVYFAIGSVTRYKEWIDFLLEKGIKKFCIDMAHGHSQPCIDTILYLKKYDKNISVMAGNIATADARVDLELAGVDSLRANIGSGSSCTTSANTGFGIPSITCLECMKKVKNVSSQIIADGGIKHTGDMVKALYFGADMVMLGKMLASTDLSPSTCYNIGGKAINKIDVKYKIEDCKSQIDIDNLIEFKEYFGMASSKARSGVLKKGSVEGVSGMLKYSGSTKELIENIKMNMHSALSYGGCKNWEELRQKVEYGIISSASILERQTHLDVTKGM